jgi:hypothetical protein
MPWIIALAFIAIVALIIVSFAVHFLFSPWLLVAVAIVAWIKFRPRRSRDIPVRRRTNPGTRPALPIGHGPVARPGSTARYFST